MLGRLLLAFTFISCSPAPAQQPSLRDSDRIRIAEAFRLAQILQDDIWEGWSGVPFALLLVTSTHEFLIRHPQPSDDFTEVGHDSLLDSNIYVRGRTLPENLRAAFPAVGNISTIVIGQPEKTEQSSTFWVLTVLHEHFHQLQNAQPDYYSAADALDLARGDKSGMWMLNYPFPYDSTDVAIRLSKLGTLLLQSLRAINKPGFEERLSRYRNAHSELQKFLSEDDYKYMSFQIWQEGVARYTEYTVARMAGRDYTPTEEFRSLNDFVPFSEAADSLYSIIEAGLAQVDLEEKRRVAFYSLGAAEALVLDAACPGWHRCYFENKFFLEKCYE
ncbi:MAG: hypothetical protein GTO29_12030 [Candidatus Latescibacteria bacterium]|nr:hypothetical protein [Candidatus Latescibacterota bacterium]NIO56892.1 hypothetical protein [Candidatus Latescibacterota bacterium]